MRSASILQASHHAIRVQSNVTTVRFDDEIINLH